MYSFVRTIERPCGPFHVKYAQIQSYAFRAMEFTRDKVEHLLFHRTRTDPQILSNVNTSTTKFTIPNPDFSFLENREAQLWCQLLRKSWGSAFSSFLKFSQPELRSTYKKRSRRTDFWVLHELSFAQKRSDLFAQCANSAQTIRLFYTDLRLAQHA